MPKPSTHEAGRLVRDLVSVSRAEYDAALKRVREAMCCEPDDLCRPVQCNCASLTLAALGLDEPTEEATPVEAYRRGGEAFWGWLREHLTVEECEAVENAGVHPDDWCAAAECCVRAVRGEHDHRPFTTRPDLVEPPTETPKACPTCKGKGTIQPITETHRCRACKGTGIDGGTPCE